MSNNKLINILANKIVRLHFFILLFLFLGNEAKAQVFPPDFQCLRNDTLFWELPVNTCGTFNSYDIFFSTNINGPYTLLDAVTDINATNYFHSNLLGETFYYYMQTNLNCAGEQVLSSDTLDNESPLRSPITLVTVNGNTVEISWNSSPSPEVTHYIVYRTSPIGSVPIDTIDSSLNNYTDFGADPNNQSDSYFILAMDFCGNTSVFDLPHFTTYVESTVDVCDQSILLDWNKYRNWNNGIDNQEVWIATNNNPFTLLTQLSAQDSTYLFTDTNDGDSYCFYIKTTEQNTGIESFSNIHCLTLNIVEPVRDLFLKNVSVNDANEVEVTWQWNNDAEVASVEFSERSSGDDFNLIDSYNTGNSIASETSRILSDADPVSGPRFYQIKSFDDCDSTLLSNEVSTIHLVCIAQNNQTNLLNWTAFERPDGQVESYDIYRIVDGISSYVETVDNNTRIFTDAVDISNPDEATLCYYVVANATVTGLGGLEESIRSQSNTFCVEQFSDILVPNAFAPEGINKEFKPRIVFGESVANYQMQIYDRWGKKIFESLNQDLGWKGRNGIRYFPGGVYVYTIRITQTNGRVVEKKGSVVLIR